MRDQKARLQKPGVGPDNRAYEMHVVVDCGTSQFDDFKLHAQALGQKALAIQVDAFTETSGHVEVMTAGKALGTSTEAIAQVGRLAGKLVECTTVPVVPVRARVELAPWHPETPQTAEELHAAGGYYEGHIQLSVPRRSTSYLLEYCQNATEAGYQVELSRNVMKSLNQHQEIPYMVTHRRSDIGLDDFCAALEDINDNHFTGFRTQEDHTIEYVVYDQTLDREAA